MATRADRRAQPSAGATGPTGLDIRGAVPGTGPVTLSEVLLQDLRVERAQAQILDIRRNVAVEVGRTLQPMIYTVLDGAIGLSVRDQPPVRVGPGDSALIFYGDRHCLGEGGAALACDPPVATQQLAETVDHRILGQGPGHAVLLQSRLELSYVRKNAHVSRAAPDLLVMRATTGPGDDVPLRAVPFLPDQLMADLQGPGALALVSAFANMQLCYALKQFTSHLWGHSIHDIRSPNMRRVATVVREITAHPDWQWTVPGLARRVGLSRSAFAAAFQEVVGEPPIAFLTRTRMERAATLLRTDSLSMGEVGQRVGYPVESSFARAFRRHWGIAPRNFAGQPESAVSVGQ